MLSDIDAVCVPIASVLFLTEVKQLANNCCWYKE